jgi:stage II sporulation protein R
MKKILKRIVLCAAVAGVIWLWGVIAQREKLNENLIRLHVVANSDSAEDQAIKLRVRDAIVESLSEAMADIADIDQARAYIQENLPKIQRTANETLKALGCDEKAVASFQEEIFDTRYYDTFTLPAGVYEALRITIGEGEGKNWWCVAFPSLCMPATSQGFADVAAGAGFPDSLTAALEGENGYEIRFFLLDLLGKWQARGVRG